MIYVCLFQITDTGFQLISPHQSDAQISIDRKILNAMGESKCMFINLRKFVDFRMLMFVITLFSSRLKEQLIRELVRSEKDAGLMNKQYAEKIRGLEKVRI